MATFTSSQRQRPERQKQLLLPCWDEAGQPAQSVWIHVWFPVYKNRLFGFVSLDHTESTGAQVFTKDVFLPGERNPANWFLADSPTTPQRIGLSSSQSLTAIQRH